VPFACSGCGSSVLTLRHEGDGVYTLTDNLAAMRALDYRGRIAALEASLAGLIVALRSLGGQAAAVAEIYEETGESMAGMLPDDLAAEVLAEVLGKVACDG
jgi:hypothetical protein